MTDASLTDDVNLGNKDDVNPPAQDPRHLENRDEGNKFARPEGFPDELWDSKTNDVNKTALIDAYNKESKKAKDLRDIIAKSSHKAPESADKYTFEISDDIKEIVGADNPAFDVFKKAAFAHGLSPEQAKGVVNDYLKGLKEGNLFAAPAEAAPTAEQMEAEAKSWREAEKKKLGEEGQRTFEGLNNAFAAAYKNGSFTDGDKEAYMNAVYNADGVHFVEKLVSLARSGKFGLGDPIPTKHMLDEGVLTKEQLDNMGSDPRMKTDPEFRKKRSEGYKLLEKKGMLS